MAKILKLEDLGLFLLSIVFFTRLPFAWWTYPLLLLTPDLGMLGYLAGPRLGAITYNTTHHLGLAAVLITLGVVAASPIASLIGVIMLGHSGLDRFFGFGLKYGDSFQHTHLGWIGKGQREAASAEPHA